MNRQQHNNPDRRTRASRLLRRALPCIVFGFCALSLILPALAQAQVNTGINQFGEATVLSGDDIRVVVARIIRTFLGLLGVIGVGIVLYGGFLWMTAKGEPDKMETAKKVLVNGAIGLAIVLSSFGIAQFVLNKLVEATGSGGGQTTTCTDPTRCPPKIPLIIIPDCVDPGGTDPYICSVVGQNNDTHPKPNGPVGSYVTLQGYRFGTFLDGTSVVKFGTTAAAVVACGRLPNWKDDLAVVEVPELDPDAYPVSLTNKDGKSTTFSSGLASGFTVTTAPLGPQIACIDPDFGPETTPVRIEGKRFGDPNPVLPPPAAIPAKNPITTSVRPMLAVRGQYVTITGTGFGSSSGRVWLGRYDGSLTRLLQAFGPTACGTSWWRDDHVVVSVPAVAILTNPYDRGFRVAPPDPNNPGLTLPSNYYPDLTTSPFQVVDGSAPPGICEATGDGRTLTVTGEGFGVGTGTVLLDGAPLTVTAWADGAVTATLPPGARSGANVSLWRAGISVSDATKASNPMPIVVVPRCLSDGTNCGSVQFTGGPEEGTSATTTAWSDTEISASVPAGAITGDANVLVDALTSNGYPFRVTCAGNNQCQSSNCCIADACFEAAACLGQSCTTDADCGTGQWCNAGRCEERRSCTTDNDCPAGQVCDETSQSCRTTRAGDPCDVDASDATCTVDATKCGESLSCNATSCQCEAQPAGLGAPLILDVSPAHRTKTNGSLERCALATDTGCAPNGAPGNLVTIRGSNFGADEGNVTIAGITAAAPAACATTDTWTDTAIIVAVPNDIIASGPIVVTAGGKSDATNDANGARIADFTLNTVVRPGLCSATNAVPGGKTTAAGMQFGDTAGTAFIGTTPVAGAGVQDWTVTSANIVVPLSIAAQQTTLAIASASGEQSNAVPLTIAQSVQSPAIESITPGAAGPGAYVTIVGQRFGHSIGRVQFRRTVGESERVYWLNAQLPRQCAQEEWWTDKRITLRIPDVLSQWAPQNAGARTNPITADNPPAVNPPQAPDWRVEVCASTGQCSALYDTPFTVTAPTDLPGICALEPVQGPRGTEVHIIGERFGAQSGNVWFEVIAASLGSGGDLQFWSEQLVRVFVPQSVEDGRQDVRLWQRDNDPEAEEKDDTLERENRGSNPVPFTVADCRTQSNVCTSSQLCCPANGQCVANAGECPVQVNQGAYQWTFTTGETPKVPRVVESCAAPSPSPWNGFSDSRSKPACPNAKVRVEFSTGMSFTDASGAMSGIKMYQCADLTFCSSSPLTAVVLGSDTGVVTVGTTRGDGANNVITIAPPVADDKVRWQQNARYQVVLHGDDGGGATALMGAVGATAFALDGDNDGNPGGNYRFEFVTGNEDCAPDTVTVAPSAAVLSQPWKSTDAIAAHPGLAHLAAEASSSQHPCQTLDERTVGTWGWASDQASNVAVQAAGNRWCTAPVDCGVLACSSNADCTSYGNALCDTTTGQCAFCNTTKSQCIGFPWTATARAVGEETPAGDPATVTATSSIRRTAQCRNGVVESGEDCDGNTQRACMDGADATGVLAWNGKDGVQVVAGDAGIPDPVLFSKTYAGAIMFTGNTTWKYPVPFIAGGNVRLELVTTNDEGMGGSPLSHHIRVLAGTAEIAALNPSARPPGVLQTSAQTLTIPDGIDALTFVWDNDDGKASERENTSTDLVVHRISLTSTQQRTCGASCAWSGEWAACAASPMTPSTSTGGTTSDPATTSVARGTSDVSVRFAHPVVGTTYPARSCRIACTNTLIAALITPESVELRPNTVTLLTSVGGADGTVGLFACGDETCRRSVLTPVVGPAPASSPPVVGFCPTGKEGTTSLPCTKAVGAAQQIVVDSPILQPDTSYRVVIDGAVENRYGVALGGLNFDRTDVGEPSSCATAECNNDSFSWTFRTGAGPCAIARLTLTPDEVEFATIGERRALAATPWSAPDACTPEGQPVDPGDGVDFQWSIAVGGTSLANFVSIDDSAANTSDNKPFTDPSLGLLLKTTVVPGPSCSTQCLLPGSRRANGICGNGVLEAPAEECEKTDGAFPSWCDQATCLRKGTTAPTCGDGMIADGKRTVSGTVSYDCNNSDKPCDRGHAPAAGEECDRRDADDVEIETFPEAWCDKTTCLRKGTSAPICGNTTTEPGEDCVGGAGCSLRCLNEGTPAIPARCGDGIVGTGEECEVCSGASRITSGTCTAINLNRSDWTSAKCSYDRCLLIGAEAKPGPSFWYTDATTNNPTPSVCGDGATGIGEACDLGNTSGYTDPVQILQSVGSTPPEGTTVHVGVAGATDGTARVSMRGVGGNSCGYDSDAEWEVANVRTDKNAPMCAPDTTGNVILLADPVGCLDYDLDGDNEIIDDHGITTQGCGAVRPRVITATWTPPTTNACPNALVGVTFDQRMDPASVGSAVVDSVEQPKGAALVRCKAGTTCAAAPTSFDLTGTDWEFVDATPQFTDVDNPVADGTPAIVSRLTFPITELLATTRKHAVLIAGTRTIGSDPVRSVAGVALYDTASWTFTTKNSPCALDAVRVTPASVLLQRREASVPLTATGFSDGTAIISLPGAYAWQYTWMSSQSDIATVAIDGATTSASCSVTERCASGTCVAETCVGPDSIAIATPTAQASGRATATATATVDVPAGSSVAGDDGKQVSGSARLQVMYCEHPWPDAYGLSWSPYVIEEGVEDIALSYCRDAGTEKVCRTTNAPQDPDSATVCTSDVDCAGESVNKRCLPRLNDDLPVPEDHDGSSTVYAPLVAKPYTTTASTTPITTAAPGARELRKEFFLLPRKASSSTTASYCSGSGERCDNLPTGFCPPGEFCKLADDAIGIRLYENEEHVAAAQWYKDEWDEDAATSVTVDGYRGVQSGRSTYINYGNSSTTSATPPVTSLFTNLAVLSYNDDATAETRTIFQRLLDGIALTQDVDGVNTRRCSNQRSGCTATLGSADVVVGSVKTFGPDATYGTGDDLAMDPNYGVRPDGRVTSAWNFGWKYPVTLTASDDVWFRIETSGSRNNDFSTIAFSDMGSNADNLHPPGATTGVYHRLRVRYRDASNAQQEKILWAPVSRPTDHQQREVVLENLPGGALEITVVWDNDWSRTVGGTAYASNLIVYRATLTPVTNSTCVVTTPLACSTDAECAAHGAGTCTAPADKLRRDVQRVEDLALLQRAITNVTEGRRRCSVTERSCAEDTDCPSGEACVALPPALASGTFLSGMTTSKWPSWQQELGRELGITLPSDPLNTFGGQCVEDSEANTGYEASTCWNATTASYTCPVGSYLYQYKREGSGVKLGVQFEHATLTDWNPPLADGSSIIAVQPNICGVGKSYSTSAAVCGDGLVAVGVEACEPGITPPQMAACTAAGGAAGFATRSCTSSCTWTIADDVWEGTIPATQCGVTCRNGVVDGRCSVTTSQTCLTNTECPSGESCTVEQCDVGAAGGRVPTRGGTVPGISTVNGVQTQYACTAQCQWTGGYCGNNAVESGYGERCDGSAGIAATRQDSTEFKQYACDTQCRPASGYCGDYIVQDGKKDNNPAETDPNEIDKGETCDNDKTEPCVSTDTTFKRSNATQIDIYSLEDSTNSATVRFQYRITSASSPPPYHPRYITNPSDAVGYIEGESAWFIPMTMDGSGDVLVTLVTSNNNGSVENVSGSAMQAYVNSSVEVDAITGFNPDGVRGTGVYHRIHLGTWNGTDLGPLVTRMVRATALTNPQTTEVLLLNVGDGTTDLILIWDNDYSSGSTDSNLAVHSITLASTRTHRCGDPGAANACVWESGTAEYSACTAIPTCGNGRVDTDKGEVCDDSRADGAFAGRCSNDPKKQCYRKPDGTNDECADGDTCEPNADACTTSCRANMCGDANQLVAQSCIAGANIGKTCRTNTDCGTGGVCAQEACDQGVAGNWTPTRCSVTLASCLDNATCAYGRTCNYCTTQCTVVTKQGGFCGDGILQAPPNAKRCDGDGWVCDDDADCFTDNTCDTPTVGQPIGAEMCERGTTNTASTRGSSIVSTNQTCNDSCTGPR